ncbi:MAG: nucleoside-triphosphatase, partial [Bacteroidales bacterium]|nr:nucleoside-triphosphatase [Bacteroidales bacterium]
FLRQTGDATMGVERFTVDEAGFKAGLKALDSAVYHHSDVIIIDEVGPLEMKSQGWHSRIGDLLNKPGTTIILAVRRSLTREVSEKYNLAGAVLLDVAAGDVVKCAGEIAALTIKHQDNERHS